MYGKGRPRPITSGVSAGKTCSWKRWSSSRAFGLARRQRDDPDAVLRERRAQLAVEAARQPRAQLEDPLPDRGDLLRGDSPSGPRASIPASTWSCSPATRTMKNSSRFDVVDGAELDPLEQRHAWVLGELPGPGR